MRDTGDAKDILQDVFYELVEANRLLMPIEHITSWLFRVARNRITDLFRKKKPESFSDAVVADADGELLHLEDLLPSTDAGPEALYARQVNEYDGNFSYFIASATSSAGCDAPPIGITIYCLPRAL